MDCRIPPASRAITAARASVEKRGMTAASSRVRFSGASRRVAAGSDATRTVMPPIHALAAEHVDHVGGEEDGDRRLHARVAAETGEEGQREQGNGERRDRGPAAGQRRAGARRPSRAASPGTAAGRAAASTTTRSQAMTAAPQITPKRVSNTAFTSPSADHTDVPAAVAACRASAAVAASAPDHARADQQPPAGGARTTRTRTPSRRAARRSDTSTAARSPGSQASRSTASAPMPTAIAPYSSARTRANATRVTGPVFSPASSWSTVAAGAAPDP